MIKSIKLIRFKQFKETRIELRPFSILMGENNSGKTSVLQAIWLALSSLYQGNLLVVDKKDSHTKVSTSGYYMYNVPFAPQGEASSLFYNKISRKGMTYDDGSGAIIEINDDNSNCFRLHLRDMFKNLNFKLLTPANELKEPTIQNYEPLYISGFVGLKFQEERMFPATLEERAASGNVHSVVRNIILDLKLHSPEKYEFLDNILRNEFGFNIKEIHFYEDNELYVFSEFEEDTPDGSVDLDFSSSGSGLMQIIQVISVILRYCPEKTKVVLIDEPDAHLHNNLQIKFANVLMEIQQQLDIQIILSTHSTAIIQNAEPEDVIPILSNVSVNTGLTCNEEVQKNVVERLDAYELGKAKISGKIAFFEDSNLEIFEKMADAAHIDCFSGVNTIPTICGRGKDDKLPYTLNNVLLKLLGRNIEIHVIRDSDGMSEETKQLLENYAKKHGVILHILSKYEIENYVLNAGLIYRALVANNKGKSEEIPTVEEIQRKIDEVLQDTIRGGIYKYSTTLNEVLYKVKHNLLGDNDYKSDNAAHEADQTYKVYYESQDIQLIRNIGMGKQARAKVLSWLNEEKRLQISKKNMLNALRNEDVCDEIKELLTSLQSDLTSYITLDKAPAENTLKVQNHAEYEQISFIDL